MRNRILYIVENNNTEGKIAMSEIRWKCFTKEIDSLADVKQI